MVVELGTANKDLRDKMKNLKVTQEELAKELGVSRATLGKWLKEPLDYEKRIRIDKAIEETGDISSSASQMYVQYDEGAFPLIHTYADDAGYDICTPIDFVLGARGSAIINTGVHVAIPRGYAGELKSKSGLNVRHSIRGEGEIDSGYNGAIVVKLYNDGFQNYQFRRGDKIIQLVIRKIATPELVLVNKLPDTDRSDNGFGSTGR